MVEAHPITFDPRPDYWYPPERRMAVAYLADRWGGRCAPSQAVRDLAFRVVQHFERARLDGLVTYQGVERGELLRTCETLAEHARRLGPVPAWSSLREIWPKLPATAADDLVAFLEAMPSSQNWERSFKWRLPWFAYLGAESVDAAQARQAFFYGYANLWTTTNAYVHAGAQSFASILQNTKSEVTLDYAGRWARGESPMQTGFLTLAKDDVELQDRAEYSTVIEVHGFLNLQRAPFYNNLAERYRDWFGIESGTNAYELVNLIGDRTAKWLDEHPDHAKHLTALFRTLVQVPAKTRVEFEIVENPKVERLLRQRGEDPGDSRLLAELDRLARTDLDALTDRDAAACALHLLLDSDVYRSSLVPEPEMSSAEPVKEPSAQPALVTRREEIPPTTVPPMRLPEGLRGPGERALAYLKAGLHVLFAGAPGTGKTTLAQFVGYAWDHDLHLLPTELPVAQAPLTTVGNSAWSPFHTIGGLMPVAGGGFDKHAGIFIDPASARSDPWRLRNGAVVLDEMNRADLDRCIGELYPLLSGSVARVAPAGLPGVHVIEASPRFRVLATVNDSTIDDIVFPISEGLSRRFQRIDLSGASKDDVFEFLNVTPTSPTNDKAAATVEAVRSFFEVVRESNLLAKSEEVDRLPFGVAYFDLLRKWLSGKLDLPAALLDATPREQAHDLLAGSLRTLGRSSRWEEALRLFESRV
jgi:MoxR-like ATPase